MTGIQLFIALGLLTADAQPGEQRSPNSPQAQTTTPAPKTSAPTTPLATPSPSAPQGGVAATSGAVEPSSSSKTASPTPRSGYPTQKVVTAPKSSAGQKPAASKATNNPTPNRGTPVNAATNRRATPYRQPAGGQSRYPTTQTTSGANGPRVAAQGPAPVYSPGAGQPRGYQSPGYGQQAGTLRRSAAQDSDRDSFFMRGKNAPRKTSVLSLSYRHFAIRDTLERTQGWHVFGFGVNPLRRYARLSFTTEVGVEGGDAAANGDKGDVFLMEKIGAGVQYPYWITPFAEFQAGAGVGRMEVYDRNELAIMMSAGIDVGAEWNVSRQFKLMAAAGWIRPWRMASKQKLDDARYYDRGTFKFGVGF